MFPPKLNAGLVSGCLSPNRPKTPAGAVVVTGCIEFDCPKLKLDAVVTAEEPNENVEDFVAAEAEVVEVFCPNGSEIPAGAGCTVVAEG